MPLDPEVVAAAAGRWVWVPEGAVAVETDDWLLVRYPDWAYTPLAVIRFTPGGDPSATLDTALEAARGLAPELASVQAVVGLGSPEGTEEAFAARDGVLVEDARVLAADLGDGVPDLGPVAAGVETRWVVTVDDAFAHNEVAGAVFDASPTTRDRAANVAAENAAKVAAGTGATVVASLWGRPVGMGGVEVAGPDARLYGGGVRADVRGHGIYRALLRHRLTYAVDHGATLAITKGRVDSSAPILRRAGFESVGSERIYELSLR